MTELHAELAGQIKTWGMELGFQQVGITDTGLSQAASRLHEWVQQGLAGNMDYMWKHGDKRTQPEQLVPGTKSIISVRMDYLPEALPGPDKPAVDALISRYAWGRDYHKTLRARLQRLAERIQTEIGSFGYRVFVDSGPVLEKPLAEKAGLGWIGKHSNIVNAQAGSWFFLGELLTDLPLPSDPPATNHCGTCDACIRLCPTQAIVRPYVVDARLCISYLTIEHREAIPEPLRPLLGNRIYGCDDCLLACPWNRFAQLTQETDFMPRQGLDCTSLIELFEWNEADFLRRTEGSAIRRIGYELWQRNLAVALGNSQDSTAITPLQQALSNASPMVGEHIQWALAKLAGD